MHNDIHRDRSTRLIRIGLLLPVFLSLTLTGLLAQSTTEEDANRNPKYEQIFNCACEDECGKNLANCNCSFSDKMRVELMELEQKGKNQTKQMDAMKKKYGKMVLAIPDRGKETVLGWVLPPAVIFLGFLFVTALGWYWVRQGQASETEPDVPESPANQPRNDHNTIDQKLEDEIQRRRDGEDE